MINSAVNDGIETHDRDMRDYLEVKFKELNDLIKSAFPDGDPVTHRLAHEERIASAKRWTALKASVMEKVVTGGIWGLIIFIAMATWEHFKRGVSS